MTDDRGKERASFADAPRLLETFQRALAQQNEAWFSVLRKATAGGYTPSQWVADMTDMAQRWYSEVQEYMPGRPASASSTQLPSVMFELDAAAEAADARVLQLLGPAASRVQATALRSIDDAPAPRGARVSVQPGAGEGQLLVALAGVGKLVTGRYVAALEDETGRVLGLVCVRRA